MSRRKEIEDVMPKNLCWEVTEDFATNAIRITIQGPRLADVEARIVAALPVPPCSITIRWGWP